MRSINKLLLCLALIVGLAGIAAPAEAATKRSVSATYSSTTPSVGAKITVSGKVSKTPKGYPVVVQRKSGSKWVTAKSTKTTSSKGAYKATVTMSTTANTYTYRVYAAKKGTRLAAASPGKSIDVRTKSTISLLKSSSSVGSGDNLTLSGVVSPALKAVSTVITIEQLTGSTWASIGTAPVVYGDFSKTFSPVSTKSYRARFLGAPGLAAGTSPTVAVTFNPAPVAPVITTSDTLAAGFVGVTYPTTSLATQGNQPGNWSYTGSLPSGMSLNSSGTLSGKPTASGDFAINVTFTHANTLTASKAFSIRIDPSVVPPNPHGSVGAGWQHTCAVSAAHELTCWGYNVKGQIGDDVGDGRSPDLKNLKPKAIGSATNWDTVDGGDYNTCGTRTDYSLWCWGDVANGVLGLGPNSGERHYPSQVAPSQHWTTVAVGARNACAISTSKALWCWGNSTFGQTGTGNNENVPTRVGAFSDWTSVDIGASHVCGVNGGKLYCWGYNRLGQLGLGASDTAERSVPTQVGSATDWVSVSTGSSHTCGIRAGGGLYCWGSNGSGQLGDGNTIAGEGGGSHGSVPTLVGSGFSSVSSGSGSTCAVKTVSDELFCWGGNSGGELGVGNNLPSTNLPVAVSTSWASVSVGTGGHVCGVKNDNVTYCWGNNGFGQLGMNEGNQNNPASFAPRPVSSDVLGPTSYEVGP